MREFKLSEEQAMLVKRKRMVFVIPLMLVAVIVGIYFGLPKNNNDNSIYVILPIVIIFATFAIYRGFNRGNKINNDGINSYKLEIFEDTIKKYQKNVFPIEINKAEILSIIETLNKGITIKTENLNNYIFIPVSVESYKELREILSGWKEIEVIRKSYSQLIQIMVPLGTIIAFGTTFLSKNKYIVIPVGITLILGLSWSLYKIQTNQHIDSRIKKYSRLVVIAIIPILLRLLSFFNLF